MRKTNTLIRTIALCLVVCLSFTLALTGCKKNEPEYSYYSEYIEESGNGDSQTGDSNQTVVTSQSTQTGNSAQGNAQNDAKVVNNCYVTGRRIAVEPVKFRRPVKEKVGVQNGFRGIIVFLVVQTVHAAEIGYSRFCTDPRAPKEHDFLAVVHQFV